MTPPSNRAVLFISLFVIVQGVQSSKASWDANVKRAHLEPRQVEVKNEAPNYFRYDSYEKDDNAEYNSYAWTGSLELHDSGFKKCLTDRNEKPTSESDAVAIRECACNTEDEKGCEGEDGNAINHPTDIFSWVMSGFNVLHNANSTFTSYWTGPIMNSETGRCLTYNYPEDDVLPEYKEEWDENEGEEWKGFIGGVKMEPCHEDWKLSSQRWIVWLDASSLSGEKMQIQPFHATHMIPRCRNPNPSSENREKTRFRGIISWTDDEIYYGCGPEPKTKFRPHPGFYRPPKQFQLDVEQEAIDAVSDFIFTPKGAEDPEPKEDTDPPPEIEPADIFYDYPDKKKDGEGEEPTSTVESEEEEPTPTEVPEDGEGKGEGGESPPDDEPQKRDVHPAGPMVTNPPRMKRRWKRGLGKRRLQYKDVPITTAPNWERRAASS
ncbi:hypothetical protein ABW19_dt0203505 [Dactylella cylindrospora]|nr:hypothetical protein ABW19_dt0203505 [Dactylella cylindrospora]